MSGYYFLPIFKSWLFRCKEKFYGITAPKPQDTFFISLTQIQKVEGRIVPYSSQQVTPQSCDSVITEGWPFHNKSLVPISGSLWVEGLGSLWWFCDFWKQWYALWERPRTCWVPYKDPGLFHMWKKGEGDWCFQRYQLFVLIRYGKTHRHRSDYHEGRTFCIHTHISRSRRHSTHDTQCHTGKHWVHQEAGVRGHHGHEPLSLVSVGRTGRGRVGRFRIWLVWLEVQWVLWHRGYLKFSGTLLCLSREGQYCLPEYKS